MRARVLIEVEIGDDIVKKYPNFLFNYEDNMDFMQNLISSLEHNTKLEECEVYKNLHPAFDNPEYDYDFFDDGYKKIVKKVKFL
jgi:hypothetical protein